MKVIALVSGLEVTCRINERQESLVPYRLVVPDFLPHTEATAKMMVYDIIEVRMDAALLYLDEEIAERGSADLLRCRA